MEPTRFEVLEGVLNQVIDWLKFAEAKNGALIAVGCASVFGAARVYPSLPLKNEFVTFYFLSFLVFIGASIILSIISFIPRLSSVSWLSAPAKSEEDNPFFFGHACKYDANSYRALFDKHFSTDSPIPSNLELAICDQITNNSKISFFKYRVFSAAATCFLLGILTPIAAIPLFTCLALWK